MRSGYVLALLFVPLDAAGASGADMPRAPTLLSYTEAVRIALGENPDLVALRLQEEALRIRSGQALAPNNPILSIAHNDFPALSLNSPSASKSTALSMTIGFPGKAIFQSRGTRYQAQSTREQALGKELEIQVALRATYAALTENERIQALLAEEVQKAQDIVKLLERKFSMAQALEVDLLNAKVTLASLQQTLIVAKNNRQLLVNQFLNLIKKPGSKDYLPLIAQEVVVSTIPLGLDDLKSIMLKNQHALLAAQYQINSVESALAQARLAPLPDLQLSLARNYYPLTGAQPAGADFLARDYSASIGLAIPIFFPFSELRGMSAAKKDLLTAKAQWESQYLAAVASLEQLYASFQNTLREKENLSRLVIPTAKASYDLTLHNYALGRADFVILSQARNAWIQNEQDLLDHEVILVQLFGQISQQLGCFIDQKEEPHACHGTP